MAKSLTELEVAKPVNLVGAVPGTKTYRVRRGDETTLRSCNGFIFGDLDSGKTNIALQLILEGLKVFGIMTDFGGTGFESVYNWFHDHPEAIGAKERFREVTLDYEGVLKFNRDPASIDPDIYEWDPDVLFWDGLSAFQQVDLEEYIGEFTPMRRENTRSEASDHRQSGLFLEQYDWAAVRNGTLRPLHKFLSLHNVKTGKRWSKIVTALDDKKGDRKEGKLIEGTEKVGPLLHTVARKISGAAFSYCLQTVKERNLDGTSKWTYVNRSPDVLTKSRGYFNHLPAVLEADFGKLWREEIAPRIGRTE